VLYFALVLLFIAYLRRDDFSIEGGKTVSTKLSRVGLVFIISHNFDQVMRSGQLVGGKRMAETSGTELVSVTTLHPVNGTSLHLPFNRSGD
jgi:hypothetical protein